MVSESNALPIDDDGPGDWPFEPFPNSALNGSVLDRFDAVAARFPARNALEDGVRSYTYFELGVLVLRIAAVIAAAVKGLPGPVAVLLSHESRFPIALLAVMAAGRGCVPLDANYPAERNRFIAADSTAVAVVSAGEFADAARELFPHLPVIDLEQIDGPDPPKQDLRPEPNDIAYILYTSGSTGRPKGVYQNHQGLLHDILQCVNSQYLSPEDRVALFYSPTVISGFRTAISALLTGASLVVLSPHDLTSIGLAREIRSRKITVFRSVATLFRHVIETLKENERFDSLRLVALGGDRVDWSDFDLFKRGCSPAAKFAVHLGATECSTLYLQWFVDERIRAESARLPVGRAVPDRKTMLLGEDGLPVPDGEVGEFVVSSRYNALGYWGGSDDASRFSIDPADPLSRVFKTGDLGLRRADGLFEHVGRRDQQFKLHGHRIEPSEIEHALTKCAGVRDAAVLLRKNDAGVPRSLVAYVERQPGSEDLRRQDLVSTLAQHLPRHLLRVSIFEIGELPRLPSFKIDRTRLSQMDADGPVEGATLLVGTARGRSSPDEAAAVRSDQIRKFVVDSFQEVLKTSAGDDIETGFDNADAGWDLLDFSFDSLSILEFCMEFERRSGLKIDPTDFIASSSIDELVDVIADRDRFAGLPEDTLPLLPSPRSATMPVSISQERIWRYSQTPEGGAAYTMRRRHRILGPLDVDTFRDCLSYITRRHEILRTTFESIDGQPVQIVHPPEPVVLPVFDLASESDPEETVRQFVRSQLAKIPDLSRGPLARFFLFRIGENEHWLLRLTHHALMDVWSARLLLKELAVLYTAKLEGRSLPLPDHELLQYADFAKWQRESLNKGRPAFQRMLAWWKENFLGYPASFDLPFKRSRAFTGAKPSDGDVRRLLDVSVVGRLNRLRREEGVTTYVVWLAAMAALLARQSGQRDIIVGSYVTVRRHAAIRNMIGDFTNLVPLRLCCDEAMTFREWLADVRNRVAEATLRCDLPYEELCAELAASGIAPPEVKLIFAIATDQEHMPIRLADLTMARHDLRVDAVMPWGVSMYLDEYKEMQRLAVAFDANMYDPAGVERFVDQLVNLLDEASRAPDLSLGEYAALSQ